MSGGEIIVALGALFLLWKVSQKGVPSSAQVSVGYATYAPPDVPGLGSGIIAGDTTCGAALPNPALLGPPLHVPTCQLPPPLGIIKSAPVPIFSRPPITKPIGPIYAGPPLTLPVAPSVNRIDYFCCCSSINAAIRRTR